MKNLALRMVLACILVLISQIAAFGQEAAKGLFNPEANVQNAITYDSRGLAKEKKGDLVSCSLPVVARWPATAGKTTRSACSRCT
jgi:hypothetical protein